MNYKVQFKAYDPVANATKGFHQARLSIPGI